MRLRETRSSSRGLHIARLLVIAALLGCDGPQAVPDAGPDAAMDAAADDAAMDGAATDAAVPDDAATADAFVAPDAGSDGGSDGGAPSSALTLDRASHAFPAIDVGESIAQSFLVSNGGGGASGALSVELVQAGAAFAIASDDCTGLSLAGTGGGGLGGCTVNVAFRPLDIGPASAELRVTEEGGAVLTASLSGDATGPARYVLEPARLDFGTVGMGTGGATATITLRNTGTRPGTAALPTITGADASSFALAGFTCAGGLAAGASCTYTIRYSPTRSGHASAALELDATAGGRATAALEGDGTDPAMVIVSPLGPVDFPTTELGARSPGMEFVVENRGGTRTAPLAVSLTGSDASHFAIGADTCDGAALDPGATCATTVDFRPETAIGSRVAALEVSGAALVNLRGSAVARRGLTASPHGHGFGNVPIGSSATQTLTITNPSALAAGPITTAITGAGAASFTITGTTCTTLAPGASCTIDVQLSSTGAPGESVATLTVSAPDLTDLPLGIAGSRVAPAALRFTPTSHAFGTVVVREMAASVTLTLRNDGAVATGTIAIGLDGLGFSMVADGCDGVTLAPGATCTVEVTFWPAVGGDVSGTLTATATVGGSASVLLTGTCDADFPLTVTLSGDGTGRVTAAPSLVCPGDCVQEFPDETVVTLGVTPEAGSELVAFSGDCTGATCSVTMDRPRTVNVELRRVRVALDVDAEAIDGASGSIVAGREGIDCDAGCTGLLCDCGATLPMGARVVLRAVPGDALSGFSGWTGACAGSGRTCEVTMDEAKSVTGTFVPYNIVFPTSEVFVPGELGGIANADAHCQRLADAADLPGTFRAWLSTSTEDAIVHVGLGSSAEPRGFVRPDGLPFADTLAELAAARVLYPPVIDEEGADIRGAWVATGTDRDGTRVATRTCSDWTSTSDLVLSGEASGGAAWTGAGSPGCWRDTRLYCFGTSYQAAVVIAEESGRRAFLSTGGFAPDSGLAAADALCAAEATAAGLTGTYRAYLATSSATAESRFDLTGATWVRVDGVRWLAAATDLASRTPLSTLNVTADGTHDGSPLAWTGVGGIYTCDNWSSRLLYGQVGNASLLRQFEGGAIACVWDYPGLYCLEQ